ncbi:rod shape-determining protein MreC [Winogradskyella maritima]|uniref:Cell shape-determining protein MreC n=1 Tax=Winogradskyella maritima TaxID=1517766 RepID=A0ABV8AH33_9FLAO|nr:rod shape-determining protein MreC [Winogradskyella maritima]
MQQIINFVIRNKTFLLFLLLFGIALSLTIQSHNYHKSQFINSANFLSGGVYGTFSGIDDYFGLKEKNNALIEENQLLRAQLSNTQNEVDSTWTDSISNGTFKYYNAKVYRNNYASTNNYLLINKGKKDGVQQDFGVLTSKGIVGIIENTSNGYSTVLSILNTKSRVNARIKATNHMGSLKWDGNSLELTQLTDISKFAPVKVGDTIVTGGSSSIFPAGIGIGSIHDFSLDPSGDTYTINVKLFNDMTNIGYVYIVENEDAEEINTLENGIND